MKPRLFFRPSVYSFGGDERERRERVLFMLERYRREVGYMFERLPGWMSTDGRIAHTLERLVRTAAGRLPPLPPPPVLRCPYEPFCPGRGIRG